MNRTEIKADDPLKVGNITLIPVAQVRSFSNVRGESAAFAGRKIAIAVVVIGPSSIVALNVEGEVVPLPGLLNEVSGLKERVPEARRSEVGGKG